ncbi:MAG TPA: MCE family protein [Acidimicrobiales bacterium]|nr:MCE family protein [Acidimicrobiales bacterium]
MSRLRPLLSGAALLAAVLLLSSCGISLQSLPKIGGVSGPTYGISANFANVVNLPANATVRVGAFSVGYVSSIRLQDFQAVVAMRIKKSARLPTGTTASIRFDTPLGEDFVLLQPPASTATADASYLRDGANIPESRTQTAPSVEDTFGALGALLDGGGINQLQTIISQTNLALNGNQAQIRSLITDLNSTVTSLASDTPAIDRSLQAMADLSKTLHDGAGTIQQGLAALGPAASVLASETGDLQGLFRNLDTLSTAADSIIAASAAGTAQTFQALKPLLDQLTSVQAQLDPALSAVTQLERYTPRAVPGDYLQLSINATIGIPPVPSDAPPLQKVTVDPPDYNRGYDSQADQRSIAAVLEGALP